MSASVIDLDLTEIHFDFFYKFGGTPQMLHTLIAAQEEDVKRWSSCPSFGFFIHKLFFQSKNISHLGPILSAGVASLEESDYCEEIRRRRETSPGNGLATLTLRSPLDGKLFTAPIEEILARLHGYGQYELHKVRVAIRFHNKTIKYVDIQAFPSENFPVARTMDCLKDLKTTLFIELALMIQRRHLSMRGSIHASPLRTTLKSSVTE